MDVTFGGGDLTFYQILSLLPNAVSNEQSNICTNNKKKEDLQTPPLFYLETFIFLRVIKNKTQPQPSLKTTKKPQQTTQTK